MADYATINLRTEGSLARLTLNRPKQRNGMTNRMVWETHAALTRVAADASVRLLLLTGAGRSFCPGADLNLMSSGERDAEDWCGPEHFQVPALLRRRRSAPLSRSASPRQLVANCQPVLGCASGCNP